MIKSVWKPHYFKSKLFYYELVEKDSLDIKKGTSAFKVIWTCDNLNCKNPNLKHSINVAHLHKEKMNLDIQICRPCQCSGEGNGRYGDNRKWVDLYDENKLVELKQKYSENWKGNKNPSTRDNVKIKKNQNIINLNFLEKIVSDKKFKLIEIIKIDGKRTKFVVKCDNGHIFEKTYSNFVRKTQKYICQKCFYDSISLYLTDEDLENFENYKKQVRALTAKSYKINKDIINPDNLKIGRGHYHLDHKFSIYEGFKNNISPEVISSLENLEILTENQNCSKQNKCSITLEELIIKTEYLLNKQINDYQKK